MKKANLLKTVLMIVLVGYAGVFYILYELPDDRFHLYFMDVGQGDSIFVKTASNFQILIDGGPGNMILNGLNQVMPFFDRSIDLLVLSHPHDDHVAGLVEVLRNYKVETVLMTGVNSTEPAYLEFLKLLGNGDSKILYADDGQDFRVGKIVIDVLYPFEKITGKYFENLNNASIVMNIGGFGDNLLLTGDIEAEIEEKLVLMVKNNFWGEGRNPLNAGILKVAHHGSKTSSTRAFLDMVDAEIAVIQCGKENRFNHPADQTIRELKRNGVNRIFRNDTDGLVEFVY